MTGIKSMQKTQALENITLTNMISILFRRKWQVVLTFVLVTCAVAVFTFLMPKQYESHMKILVKNKRADMIVSAGRGDGSGYHGEVSESEINSEIELLNGINLLQNVVVKCGLEKLEKSHTSDPTERLPVAIERATLHLQRDLTITPVRKANIIQIDYSSHNPQQAAAVLRQLAESYLEEHLKVHGTPGTYQFFASQAEHYQIELQDAEAKLKQFRQQNSIVMLAEQKDVVLQRASELDAALMQATAAIRETTDKVADTRKQLADEPSRIITQDRAMPNQYSVEHLSSMLAELQNRRTQLLAKFNPEDRFVQEAEKEIADTQSALDKATNVTASEKSTDINPVHQTLEIDRAKGEAELAGIQARRQTLARQVQAYRAQLMTLGNATAQYDDLTRTQKIAEENFLLYAKKTEEARIAESLDRQKIANVAIAEPPTEPHVPSKPKVGLNLVLGTILAAFLSLGLAFASEYVQQLQALPSVQLTVKGLLDAGYSVGLVERRSELEALTDLPILATVHPAMLPEAASLRHPLTSNHD
jgi:uncharacterized protein involved in exopolysaccharide biosynthesis